MLHFSSMRPASIALLLLVAATSAYAAGHSRRSSDNSTAATPSPGDVTEIRLGEEPPPPPAVDPARIHAIERFLSARQDGSLARAKGHGLRVPSVPLKGATPEELFGPKAARLVAYDFQDDAIESTGPGRFQVTAYLLFANESGEVVESRDETLAFAGSAGAWGCVSRATTASMTWSSDGVLDTAESLGVSDELREACVHLRDWTIGRNLALAYSVADIAKEENGRVVIQCLRFTAAAGHRGFDVNATPLVLTRERGVLRVESN